MRKIESLQDDMNGTVTYEIAEGRWVTLDARIVREIGLKAVMESHGVEMPTGRLPVFQRGREIGSLPVAFDPLMIKSTSFLYDPRPGDFRRTDKGWVAADNMGPGDFECIPEFSRSLAENFN